MAFLNTSLVSRLLRRRRRQRRRRYRLPSSAIVDSSPSARPSPSAVAVRATRTRSQTLPYRPPIPETLSFSRRFHPSVGAGALIRCRLPSRRQSRIALLCSSFPPRRPVRHAYPVCRFALSWLIPESLPFCSSFLLGRFPAQTPRPAYRLFPWSSPFSRTSRDWCQARVDIPVARAGVVGVDRESV